MKLFTNNVLPFNLVYEGEGDPPPPPPPPAPPPPPPPGAKMYTQEQINAMMADNKRSLQKQNESYAKQLEEFKNNYTMSEQQKATFEQQIEELRTSHLTDQEKIKREQEKLEKDYKT